jgi:hypothetical protein
VPVGRNGRLLAIVGRVARHGKVQNHPARDDSKEVLLMRMDSMFGFRGCEMASCNRNQTSRDRPPCDTLRDAVNKATWSLVRRILNC